MNAIHKTEVIGGSILSLEQALERFIKHIEQPKPIPERGRVLFRYEHPSALIFLTLKAVRVVSGLNAAVYLLKRGFIQELGVVIRTRGMGSNLYP